MRAMFTRAKTSPGFTIVEIIITLVIVGILAFLILNSLQTVQAKSRDALRRSDMDSIAKNLEACYGDKDKCDNAYPTVNQLTDTSPGGFLATNFPNFNNEWIYDSSAGLIQTGDASPATQYQYITTPDGCSGTFGDTKCTGFTLKAYQETNPQQPYVKDSFNK
jgi:prepilin-type N-terminal cleavage/methylation domain-containing protein